MDRVFRVPGVTGKGLPMYLKILDKGYQGIRRYWSGLSYPEILDKGY